MVEHNSSSEDVSPDVVVVGNVTVDKTAQATRTGGTAAYASMVAACLGLRSAVVTRAPSRQQVIDSLPGVSISCVDSDRPTLFEEWYEHGRRRQRVRSIAGSINLAQIPSEMRGASTVLLGPVLSEVDPAAAAVFSHALIGATAQGWLRRLSGGGEVTEGYVNDLDVSRFEARLTVLVVSEEDLRGEPVPNAWKTVIPIVIVTLGHEGLRIYSQGRWLRLRVFPAVEQDPTGAGDALAIAFLVRYGETRDLGESARFAAAVASFVIEAPGFAGAPSRAQVEHRMQSNPEIRLTIDL